MASDRAELQASALSEPLLTDEQQGQLDRYATLLARWNRTFNLTALRDAEASRTRHLLDCLAVVRPLSRHLGSAGHPRILDVGSGGGLPGVVLAVARSDWAVTCVDTVAKKAAFVQQVAVELQLKNLRAWHRRVESVNEPFDVITCRAFSSLADLVRLSARALAPTGVWVAMKARLDESELAEAQTVADVFHVEQLEVPGLEHRRLIWMKPLRLDA